MLCVPLREQEVRSEEETKEMNKTVVFQVMVGQMENCKGVNAHHLKEINLKGFYVK